MTPPFFIGFVFTAIITKGSFLMQHFWGIIHETDVSSYAGTLILPGYMSYLQLAPFRFAGWFGDKMPGQNLQLTYFATGRIEEFELNSTEHALNLLCHVYETLDRDRITSPASGAHWNWPVTLSQNRHSDEDGSAGSAIMKIYFEPIQPVINRVSETPFAPEKAYLSFSRKKLFIHQEVIFEYYCQKMADLGYSVIQDRFDCSMTSMGFLCTDQRITWEWIPEWDVVFNDLLIFSGCRHWIDHLKNDISICGTTIDINLENEGVYIDISKSILNDGLSLTS